MYSQNQYPGGSKTLVYSARKTGGISLTEIAVRHHKDHRNRPRSFWTRVKERFMALDYESGREVDVSAGRRRHDQVNDGSSGQIV